MQRFVTWQPAQGGQWSDAMSRSWLNEHPYIFPPARLLTKILHKIQREKVTALIVTSHWPTQAYFSMLKKMAIQTETLPQRQSLVTCAITGQFHPIWKHLKLTAYLVQGQGL